MSLTTEKVLYTAKAHSKGGRNGESRSSDGRLDIKLSSPGTTGGGANPEQLFAAGWSAWAKALGFGEVIDTSAEKLGDGVRRITGGYGADIVIDGIGGEVLSEALGALAPGGSLTTLGYSGGRKTTIDVTNLIWQQASIKSFILFAQPQAAFVDAWNTIVSLLGSGAIKPIVAKTFPLAKAADALRYLVEGRPFGRVVLTI